MKARLVSENVNFERGLDPKDSMGIGQGVLKSHFNHKFAGPKTSMEEAEGIILEMDLAMGQAIDGEDQEYAYVWGEDELAKIGWYEVHEPLNIIGEGVNFVRGGDKKTIMKRILGDPGKMMKHRFHSRTSNSMVFIQGVDKKWYEIGVWMRAPGRGGRKSIMFFPERDYEEFQYDPGELEEFTKWEKNRFEESKDDEFVRDGIELIIKNLGVVPHTGGLNESNFVRGGGRSEKLGRILGYPPGTLLRGKDLGYCLMAYGEDQFIMYGLLQYPDIPGKEKFHAYVNPSISKYSGDQVDTWNAQQMEAIKKAMNRRPKLLYKLSQLTTAKLNYDVIKESVNFERTNGRSEILKRVIGPQLGDLYMDRRRFPYVFMLIDQGEGEGSFMPIAMVQGGGQKKTKLRFFSPRNDGTYTRSYDVLKPITRKIWDMLDENNIDFGEGDYWTRIERTTGIEPILPVFESVSFKRGASPEDIKREFRAKGPYQPGEIVVRDTGSYGPYSKTLQVYMEFIPAHILAPHKAHSFGTIDNKTGKASLIHYTEGSGVSGLQDNDRLRRATRKEAIEIRKALQSGKYDRYIENVKKNTGLTPFV